MLFPFAYLMSLESDHIMVIPCLVLVMLGNIFFIIIELINLWEEGYEEYMNDASNVADYILGVSYIVYFVLAFFDHHKSKESSDVKDNKD